MHVTIVRGDNTVVVDGERHTVDCSKLPANFHALQWYGMSGEIEYAVMLCEHCKARSKKSNETIHDLTPYQPYVDGWNAAKEKAEQEKAKVNAAAGPTG